jgi:hypothetical protein
MRAEKLLIKEGCAIKLIPTPRELSSDCGIAVRFCWSECQRIKSVLEAAGVEVDTVRQIQS